MDVDGDERGKRQSMTLLGGGLAGRSKVWIV